jgi:hypothetical protein
MPSNYSEIEERIEHALKDLHEQQRPNLAKTARRYSVPPKRLRNGWNNIPSKQDLNNRLPKLSPEQDLALIHTLDRLDKCELSARVPMLVSIANGLLARAHLENTPPPTVSVSCRADNTTQPPFYSLPGFRTPSSVTDLIYS